jgi:hypothetical protein
MKTRHIVETLVLGALAALVFMPWGCGQNAVGPVPSAGPEQFSLPNGVVARPGELLSGTSLIDPDSPELGPKPEIDSTGTTETNVFTQDVDSAGGEITLDVQKDTAYFVVPDRALDKEVRIEITVTRDLRIATHVTTMYDCKPDGLVFEKTAWLSCRTWEKEGDVQFLWWWDEEKGDWYLYATAIVTDGYATFPIEHFSKYATTERVVSLGGQQ